MSKRWVFTWNSFFINDDGQPKIPWFPTVMNYLVCQHERVSHDHLQGYLEFKEKHTLVKVKKYLPGAHLKPAKGSPESNLEYCTKLESRVAGPWIHGEPEPWEQGARNDLGELYDMIGNGATILDCADAQPGSTIRYMRGIERLIALRQPKRRWLTAAMVVWGPTGAGKSTVVRKWFPDAYHKQDGKWWDGYSGEETVIWNDFDTVENRIPMNYMLKLIDRDPMIVETKGGHVQMLAKLIVFTSNNDPKDWYGDPHGAMRRRLSNALYYDGKNPEELYDLDTDSGSDEGVCEFADDCYELFSEADPQEVGGVILGPPREPPEDNVI